MIADQGATNFKAALLSHTNKTKKWQENTLPFLRICEQDFSYVNEWKAM